jgi:hypothetical protein
MTKIEFKDYLKKPYNVDLQQLFTLHVEDVVEKEKLRKVDKIFLEAFLKDRNNRQMQAQATNIIEKLFEREG